MFLLRKAWIKELKVFKELLSVCEFIYLKMPYSNHIDSWLDFLIQKRELRLSEQAKKTLKYLVGDSLIEIDSELQKLQSLVGAEDKVLSDKDILDAVPTRFLESIFLLTDLIGKKDVVNSLVTLARLLDSSQNEHAILSLIARHFRILSQVLIFLKQGLRGRRLAQKIGLPFNFLSQYEKQASFWTVSKIGIALSHLSQVEKALKSSRLPAYLWIENFIVKSCS